MCPLVVAVALVLTSLVQPAAARAPGRALAYSPATRVVAAGRSVPAAHAGARPRLLAESTSGRFVAWEEPGSIPYLEVWDRETGAVEDAALSEEATGVDTGPRDSFVVTTPAGLSSATVMSTGGVRVTPLLSAGRAIRGVADVISDGSRLLIAKPAPGASNLGGPCAIYELRGSRLTLLVPGHARQNLCVRFVSFRAGQVLYTEGVAANHCAGVLHVERISLRAPGRGTALQFPPPPSGDVWMVPSVGAAGGSIVASLIPLPAAGCFAKNAPTTFRPELWRYTGTSGWNPIGHVPAWHVAVEPSGRLAVVAGLVHAPRGLGIPQLTGPGTLEEQTPTGGWRVVARGVYDAVS